MPLTDPIVSVVIANFNGERFLADALASARNQTLRDVEMIVIDDASSDASREIADAAARADGRIRVLPLATRSGPGAARNAGLSAARGRWIAILDNDDLMHPSRLEQLVAEAEAANADLIADDLLIFGDGTTPTSLLSARQRTRGWLSAADFIAGNKLLTREPVLGYLKPLIRTAFLREHGLSYTPDLPIGEDYDLVVQLLAKGARFRVVESLGYFYRKHSQSTSHRMSGNNVAQMLAADARLRTLFGAGEADVARAFETRKASIERAAAYGEIIATLKKRDWRQAAALMVGNPRALPLLAMPIAARWRKLTAPRGEQPATDTDKRVALISRQRLVGNSNGSSAYLLALAKALRDDGHKITLISPSMSTFGRWPFLRLRPEMDAFDEIHVRGSWKIRRRLYIAKDPRIAINAALTIASRLVSRLGVKPPSAWDRPAPYAIAEPWHREDQLFIARHAPRAPKLVLVDYAFTTPGIPYALAPSARSAVVMHDFFSARAERFREQKLADSVAWLDQATELRLLAGADAVIAIQKLEGAEIARLLPERQVIVAPLASRVKEAPQPGDDRTLLFVGSNTAPNVIGLQWFIEAIWPEVRRRTPDVRLLVAGGVAAAFPDEVPGVRFLGMVADLDPPYAEAGVVISPLTVGSGLKIKLVEALGQGKAVVATSVTTEGYEDAAIEAIFERDEPQPFADAVVDLLTNEELRRAKAADALDVARRFYSPEACYRDLLSFVSATSFKTGRVSDVAPRPASVATETWEGPDAPRTANRRLGA
ncbi:glycosyltransferase [Hyphomicrobium sp. CS1GBMeth3]|uniref:glycosyltransferase n=1 Tax=Hyphomicrobium sp. CS1GBMeth3 TaxID=1892845 RepID=UPI0009311FC0|nr:glycosyltransferase [Hyphomicrobium sp. CS1GBMeth3]